MAAPYHNNNHHNKNHEVDIARVGMTLVDMSPVGSNHEGGTEEEEQHGGPIWIGAVNENDASTLVGVP